MCKVHIPQNSSICVCIPSHHPPLSMHSLGLYSHDNFIEYTERMG